MSFLDAVEWIFDHVVPGILWMGVGVIIGELFMIVVAGLWRVIQLLI